MKKFIGLLAGFIATVCWGSFYVAGRWLFGEDGDNLNVCLFNFLRFFMASAVLSPLLLVKRNRLLVKEAFYHDLKPFLLITSIGIVLESYLIFYSLNFTTASRSALMANFSPVITVLRAFLLRGEKCSKMAFAGMIIGSAGIILAGVSQGSDTYTIANFRTFIGDIMALASGVCWAFFTVYGVGAANKYGGAICMFICFLIGTALMLPLQFFTAGIQQFTNIPLRVWLGMLYTGVVTLALANACYYAALRYIRPGVLGAFGYLSAGITFSLSVIMLNERFTLTFILATAMLTIGMTLMMLNPGKCRSGNTKC